jgi:class 3 adenylate cyclase/DNA-binding SARP family transcriptional activator
MSSNPRTAAFLFTDLEDSTPLWEGHPVLMQKLAARHDTLLREAIEAHRGRVVKTMGDGFHAVFDATSDAVAAALSAQQAMIGESWPAETGPLQVRMGLHTGESREREGDYYGPEVNRAARVMSVAHGGQVLLSEATAALIRKALPVDVSLSDLGTHRLKGIAAAEQIFQLCHPALPVDFPPLNSLSATPANIPTQATPGAQLPAFLGKDTAAPAQPLSLLLLGPLEISLDGQPVKFRTTKAQALLIFLCAETALHPTAAIRREALLALLWPDYPERSARQSLRTNLSYLRKAIPELQARTEEGRAPFLLSDNQGVQPNPAVHYELDLATFSLLLDQCRKHEHDDLLACSECQERLQQATELYRGDFAADFYLPDSSQFEEWVLARRAQLRRQALDALATLTAFGIKGGDFDYAEGYARRQLEIDNLRESAHRQLMEALARNGRRRAALSHFETMQQLLASEMGLAPSAETEALVEAIQSGDLTQPVKAAPPATAAVATPGAELPAFLGEDAAAPAPESVIFVGRKQLLAQLDSHVAEMVAGHGRVVFVTGEVGQGKSTLLHEIARRAGEDHPDLRPDRCHRQLQCLRRCWRPLLAFQGGDGVAERRRGIPVGGWAFLPRTGLAPMAPAA